jgi:predicted nuclease of predicted toxin-antitoxin system
MKFLVDAQLPIRLARWLQSAGYDTLHTRDLPQQNSTPDSDINQLSVQEQRIVITKDSDFVDSFLLQQQPYKLLMITTGNINNTELERLFSQNLPQIVTLFQIHSYLELNTSGIVAYQ